METLKRILVVIVMVVSALVLVLTLAGIVGVWSVRSQLAGDLVGILTAAEAKANAAQQQLDQLDATLAQARDQVAAVEQQVQEVGTNLEQNEPLLTAISDRLGVNLAPLVDRARGLMATIRETAAAVNSIVEAVNALPFISTPLAGLEGLNELSQEIEGFQTEVQNLRTAIEQRRTEIIQGAVSIITTPTSQIVSRLDAIQARVSGYSQQLVTVQEGLSTLKSTVESGLTWLAVILTLMLLWLAFSQVALLVLGWRAFTGREILPRKQQPAPVPLAGGLQ